MRWSGHVACMGERRGVYRALMGKPEGKRPFGRPRRRWEDDIKMEVGCGGMNWIELDPNRDRWRAPVNVVMNLRVTYNAGNFLTSLEPVSFSRRTLLHGVSKYLIRRHDRDHDRAVLRSIPSSRTVCCICCRNTGRSALPTNVLQQCAFTLKTAAAVTPKLQ
jgi:hypothetical protein